MKKSLVKTINGSLAIQFDLSGLEGVTLHEGDEIEITADNGGLRIVRSGAVPSEVMAAYEACKSKYGETLKKLAE
ncbi:MAG: hypothetical protein GC168_03700 [Candidatus Hydrogenedens sp.]|nr:hypothetical protein [Candidatus Hydrogenedens sp.]